ncbi:MAG: hypothetical protein ACYSPJ_03410 [Planctomycetota bacterium]
MKSAGAPSAVDDLVMALKLLQVEFEPPAVAFSYGKASEKHESTRKTANAE